MFVAHHRPTGALRGVIDRYWEWKQTPDDPRDLMPVWPGPGGIEIFFHLGKPFHMRTTQGRQLLSAVHTACARSGPLILEASAPLDFIAVRVRAGMALRLFDMPMQTMIDRCVDGSAAWGSEVHALHRTLLDTPDGDERASLLDRFLLQRLRPAPTGVDLSCAITALEEGDVPIATLSRLTGIGPRQLEHRFRACTGVTPARFRRLSRLRRGVRTLLLAPHGRSASLLDDAYVDQAHQIREFREFTGRTPRQVREAMSWSSHFYNRPW